MRVVAVVAAALLLAGCGAAPAETAPRGGATAANGSHCFADTIANFGSARPHLHRTRPRLRRRLSQLQDRRLRRPRRRSPDASRRPRRPYRLATAVATPSPSPTPAATETPTANPSPTPTPPAVATPTPTPTPTSALGPEIQAAAFIGACELYLEVADDPEERAVGLMGRESLRRDRGMVFVYAEDQILSFWMKGTLIPLGHHLHQWRFGGGRRADHAPGA